MAALRELARVLKPGGSALVTVWARSQPPGSRRVFEAADVLVGWELVADSARTQLPRPREVSAVLNG